MDVASLDFWALPCEIHKDAAHQLGADTKEMGTILPSGLFPIDETDINFVHQGRRLQHVVRPLLGKVPLGQTVQFGLDQWNQLIQSLLIAFLTPGDKQPRRFVFLERHENSQNLP